MLKLATRKETKGIALHFVPDKQKDKLTAEQLDLKERQRGEINLGYHYVIHKNGTLEAGIQDTLLAKATLRRSNDCICVLILSKPPLNKAQRTSLETLCERYGLEVVENGDTNT